ncbi:hypothetical protein FIBSPDRAFT_931945 [Athelia psychrophila]|uniref:DUF6533 domain-containing protein n=1 Tax=Athelia psychrophila TaxID=1759441 RepID=A0A166JJA2_9AGAM|nr:hypothetical protein FIBSPDRAFT_931945 [Fibularhizoctonia sp. CBS 109695]
MKPVDAASSNQLELVFNLASAPPLLAQEAVTITAYCYVAVFTTLVWTWALCVPEEVEIVQRKGLSMTIVTYYLSRLAALGGCVCSTVTGLDIPFHAAEIQNSTLPFFWITQSSTGLLFFFRIRAVYTHSKSVRYGFFVMWMLATAAPSLMLLYPNVRCSMPHKHCYIWGPATLPGNVTVLTNDALVFVGVSLHAYRSMTLDTSYLSHARRFKLLIQGHGLYKVSRMLLKSGQLYYGVIIGVQICATITVFLGPYYSKVIYVAYTSLASTLACKVFRMVMLCDTTEDPLNTLEIHEMIEIGIKGIE